MHYLLLDHTLCGVIVIVCARSSVEVTNILLCDFVRVYENLLILENGEYSDSTIFIRTQVIWPKLG